MKSVNNSKSREETIKKQLPRKIDAGQGFQARGKCPFIPNHLKRSWSVLLAKLLNKEEQARIMVKKYLMVREVWHLLTRNFVWTIDIFEN